MGVAVVFVNTESSRSVFIDVLFCIVLFLFSVLQYIIVQRMQSNFTISSCVITAGRDNA